MQVSAKKERPPVHLAFKLKRILPSLEERRAQHTDGPTRADKEGREGLVNLYMDSYRKMGIRT